jgi:hypothetical protein
MRVTLPPQLAELVKQKVDGGLYGCLTSAPLAQLEAVGK